MNTAATTRTAATQRIAVGNDTYTCRELGPEGGVPLVCLPHFTAVIDDWDPRTIDAIATTRRVILFDNRGVGGSTGSVPLSVDAMARDAVAFTTGSASIKSTSSASRWAAWSPRPSPSRTPSSCGE